MLLVKKSYNFSQALVKKGGGFFSKKGGRHIALYNNLIWLHFIWNGGLFETPTTHFI